MKQRILGSLLVGVPLALIVTGMVLYLGLLGALVVVTAVIVGSAVISFGVSLLVGSFIREGTNDERG